MDYKVFDAHSDIPSRIIQKDKDIEWKDSETNNIPDTVLKSEFLPDMRNSNIKARIAAVYIDEEYLPQMALERALTQVTKLKNEVELHDNVDLITGTYDENIIDKLENDNISFILGMEGLEPVHRNINLLETFYDLGVRVVGFTHARRNLVGTGPKIYDHNDSLDHGGLSYFGIDVVKKINNLNMIIDTAHINESGFWDIIEHSDKPIINSHSNCRNIYDHPRNLYDDQIKAISENNGVVGINALAPTYESENPTINDMVNHITHISNIAGIDHLGIGLDFFAYLYGDDDKKDITDLSGLKSIQDDSEVSNLPEVLDENGFTDEEIRKILWKNNVRVIKEVLE